MIGARVVCCSLLPLILAGEIPNAPGQLIDIGGTRLHVNCSGTGSPVVLLEAAFPVVLWTGLLFSLAWLNSLVSAAMTGPVLLKGQQLHRELAALSVLGEWIPVAGANHYIHLSQPAAVIDAIRKVVRTARTFRAVPADRP